MAIYSSVARLPNTAELIDTATAVQEGGKHRILWIAGVQWIDQSGALSETVARTPLSVVIFVRSWQKRPAIILQASLYGSSCPIPLDFDQVFEQHTSHRHQRRPFTWRLLRTFSSLVSEPVACQASTDEPKDKKTATIYKPTEQ